jgi:TATA-box binding protein (TBP) (component of TFIID and TFIIIB)
MELNDEWEMFNAQIDQGSDSEPDIDEVVTAVDTIRTTAPAASDIYISTKTKIAYLNIGELDINSLFWNINVIPYHTPTEGVIKKQIKFNSTCEADLTFIQERLHTYSYYTEHIITSINNPQGRITFKDVRKITIGLSKKDIMSYRCRQKSAFYNCFVIIVRLEDDERFKEFHVKIFNTGKLEIPGIQSDTVFERLLVYIVSILAPHVAVTPLEIAKESSTVLINSNFNCNFHINREILYQVLKTKYNVQCIYDPCSYPGVQCKFFYNHDLLEQTGVQSEHATASTVKVSFMIFRTGSVLIVGMCDEMILHSIYDFLKKLLWDEYHTISQATPLHIELRKAKKVKKKTILVNA